ncbi:major facilitator superfamily domain-containing protein [Zychaea mexicana]|uniref:major facilitator superfamily domain-containing protein n=1 Tax=Zychaea mexicana TaxID=64656 RepID=UPI0022FF28D2|nr:major facilitator superfamily domain-containing protein [Zychaea mexicana]KAI9489109.1 major facilitator superfamily domain-containing protein [Zychaea mexicana]
MEQYKHLISGDRGHGNKWDTVFLGGLLGSLFSLLQFIVSPIIGRASDRFGRRKVLLYTMIGNLLSTGIWIFARSFTMFLLARIVAGLSEGNVQLSIAIISDVTPPLQRSRSLALVGIAFAVAFTFGPAIGAWFASVDLSKIFPGASGIYPFSMPAIVALVLLSIETLYIFNKIPETKEAKSAAARKEEQTHTKTLKNNVESVEQRISNLRRLKLIHCLHLFLFSGMEFTLVFLTFDVLDYSNMQQGKLLGYMGILSALLQGGYVRRQVQRLGEKMLVLQGMAACVIGLSSLAMVASSAYAVQWLYFGVSCLALTTGTVVNCLTGLASLQCQEEEDSDNDKTNDEKKTHPSLAKGRALGEFRSSGQLGRALGPVSACGLYWLAGPTKCYGTGAIIMSAVTVTTFLSVPSTRKVVKTE